VRPGTPVGDGASSVVDGSVVGLGGELGNDVVGGEVLGGEVLGGEVLGGAARVGGLVVVGRLGTTATGPGDGE
jgi:hypothetical protein